jgi:hypothetical protein
MRLLKSLLIFIALLACLGTEVYAGNGNSNASGFWNNPSTWLFAGIPRVPTCGDTITIDTMETVTVNNQNDYTACITPMIIHVYGILQFTNGNKLSLPCNSVVYIHVGGLVRKATAGGGNSTFIEICNEVLWNAGMGDLSGPDTLQVGSPLPITLLSFNAEPAENKVDVTWTTALEINNDYFTVEKSADGTDFTSIGTVNGAGNSSVTLSYYYPDHNPVYGVSYYRLKQTDFDGQFSYSPIVMVNYSGEFSFDIVIAFINEDAALNVFFTNGKKEKCHMSIYDVIGKSIYIETVESGKGMNYRQLQIPEMVQGIYFVTLTNGKETVSRRFVR